MQRNLVRGLPLFGGIVENRYPFLYFGDRISPEAREARHHADLKFRRGDIRMQRSAHFVEEG